VPKNFKMFVLSKTDRKCKGSHSGLAKEEMFVPLIMIGDK